MTIALLIANPPDETRLVPVAFENVFTDYWQLGCSELRLEWVPLFQSGISISQDLLPVVLEELSRLKGWMESPESVILENRISITTICDDPQFSGVSSPTVRQYVLERISNLILELEKLPGSTAEIWIG